MADETKANILLVDDRPENLLALEAILEGLGQNLITASSGEEALKVLLKHEVSVILLDVQMPGLSGLETAELIKAREKTRHIPIIFLTAINKEERFIFEGYSVGAVDFLFKPFDPVILRSKVAVFVDLYRKNQQIKAQAEALERSTRDAMRQKALTELILDSAASICGIDRQGRITFINKAGAALLGYGHDELIGQPIHGVVHHSHPDGSGMSLDECAIHQTLRDGAFRRVEDEVFWRKDGECFPVEFQVNPLREDGVITGAVVSFVDITERRQAQTALEERTEALEEANTQLRQADRYKDEFLSVLSHELRTPINAITGFGSILDDEVLGPLSEEQHHYLKKMLAGADVLLCLINDLLDMSRIQAGKFVLSPRMMDFGAVVQDVIENIRPLAERKGHELVTEIEPDLPAFWADDQRVAQILVNLVNNAIKFTPDGGYVMVRALRDADSLLCEVSDTGIGIAAGDLPKLFQRFTQLDSSSTREAGGTGLGLAITKTLVESHGGTIGVQSEKGHGSRFWFRLPMRTSEDSGAPVEASQIG